MNVLSKKENKCEIRVSGELIQLLATTNEIYSTAWINRGIKRYVFGVSYFNEYLSIVCDRYDGLTEVILRSKIKYKKPYYYLTSIEYKNDMFYKRDLKYILQDVQNKEFCLLIKRVFGDEQWIEF